jgi:hypothetical protein
LSPLLLLFFFIKVYNKNKNIATNSYKTMPILGKETKQEFFHERLKSLLPCWAVDLEGQREFTGKETKTHSPCVSTLCPKIGQFGLKGKAASITFLQSPKYPQHDKTANVK